MDPVLAKIKRLVLAGRLVWTVHAETQMAECGLDRQAVVEAILNAQWVQTKRSRSPWRRGRTERVHIIKSFSFDGVFVYVKGVVRTVHGRDEFYVIVSAKKAD
ncbi:MAG: hypothetical protein HY744_30795 [Deltaproteobacteria bacterium]|nr:hypothetical protein [Deltaproteobacteria bacterium]